MTSSTSACKYLALFSSCKYKIVLYTSFLERPPFVFGDKSEIMIKNISRLDDPDRIFRIESLLCFKIESAKLKV